MELSHYGLQVVKGSFCEFLVSLCQVEPYYPVAKRRFKYRPPDLQSLRCEDFFLPSHVRTC